MEHLRYKRAFLRVVSGMLILHILTDVLTFLWHFLFGISDPLYMSLLGPHPTLIRLLSADLSLSWFAGLIHIGNVVALLFLMLAPIAMWFVLYFDKKLRLNKQAFAFISFGLFTLLLNPTFTISALRNKLIYGVDIAGVVASRFQILPFIVTVLIALTVALVLSIIDAKVLQTILVIASKLFFVSYVVLYFISISGYYLSIIPSLWGANSFLSLVMGFFFVITTLFYVIGLGSFLIDTTEHLKEHLTS